MKIHAAQYVLVNRVFGLTSADDEQMELGEFWRDNFKSLHEFLHALVANDASHEANHDAFRRQAPIAPSCRTGLGEIRQVRELAVQGVGAPGRQHNQLLAEAEALSHRQ